MNLTEIRQQYPQYNDLSDQQLADGFHDKFYSDIPKNEFYQKIGYSTTPNLSDQVSDKPLSNNEWYLGQLATLAQGASMGFGDEAVGMVGGDKAKQDYLNLIARYKKEEPTLAAATEFGGAIASPINKVLPKGLIAGGATLGAIQGAGDAKGGLGERIKGAGFGGALGATTGVALKGAGAAAKGAWRLITGAGEPVEKIIANKLGNEVDDVLKNLQENPSETLLEQKDNMLGLAKDTGRASPEAAKGIRTALEERASGESGRIEKSLDKLTPMNASSLDDLVGMEKGLAGGLYDEAYKAPPLISDKLSNIIENRLPQNVVSDAKQIAKLQGRPFETANGYGTQTIDDISRSLADDYMKYKNAGQSNMANALKTARKELLDEVDKLNPKFGEARAQAGDYLEKLNGFDEGQKFFNSTPRDVLKSWNKLSTTEQQSALVGFKNKALEEINKISEGRMNMSLSDKVIGSKNQKDVLNILFGDNKQGYNDFIKSLQSDIKANQSFKQIYGRLYPSVQEANMMPAAALPVSRSGVVSQLAGGAIKSAQNRMAGINAQNAPLLAHVLTDRDAAIQLLTKIRNTQNLPANAVKDVVNYVKNRLPVYVNQKVNQN